MAQVTNIKKIAEYVAANNGISRVSTEAMLKDAFSFIKDELRLGEEVVIAEFGKFVPVRRECRPGRNPHTGGVIEIPARVSVKFKPLKSLRDEVNDADL